MSIENIVQIIGHSLSHKAQGTAQINIMLTLTHVGCWKGPNANVCLCSLSLW